MYIPDIQFWHKQNQGTAKLFALCWDDKIYINKLHVRETLLFKWHLCPFFLWINPQPTNTSNTFGRQFQKSDIQNYLHFFFPTPAVFKLQFCHFKNKIRVWERSSSMKATFVFTVIRVGSQEIWGAREQKWSWSTNTQSKASGWKVHSFWHLEMMETVLDRKRPPKRREKENYRTEEQKRSHSDTFRRLV